MDKLIKSFRLVKGYKKSKKNDVFVLKKNQAIIPFYHKELLFENPKTGDCINMSWFIERIYEYCVPEDKFNSLEEKFDYISENV